MCKEPSASFLLSFLPRHVLGEIWDLIESVSENFFLPALAFLDGDVPRLTSHGVYISQLIRFARVSNHVDDLNTRNFNLIVTWAVGASLTPIPGCLRSGLSRLNWWVSFPPDFQCCCLCESSYLSQI